MEIFSLQTTEREALIDITPQVKNLLLKTKIQEGLAFIYSPHTTAAITINEGADPDVCSDMLMQLAKLAPYAAGFRHMEGNSDAHIKTSLLGASAQVIISQAQLQLGTWQKIFFAEFDGPRKRKVWTQFL